MVAHLFTQPFSQLETRGILLCRDNQSRLSKGSKAVVDEGNVFLLEVVMVTETERRQVWNERLQVVCHLLWRGYACQQENVMALELRQCDSAVSSKERL